MKLQKKLLVCLIVMIMSCLMTTGCVPKNETLDQQAELVINALNTDDGEALAGLFYPNENVDYSDAISLYEDYWIPVNFEDAKLISLNISYHNTSEGRIKTIEGIYQLPRDDHYSQMKIRYAETDNASGITDLYLGTYSGQTTTASVVKTVFRIICLIIILISIIDILRQRPPKFGIYLVVVTILTFSFSINDFKLTIPIGAVAYWAARKQILSKKNKDEPIE